MRAKALNSNELNISKHKVKPKAKCFIYTLRQRLHDQNKGRVRAARHNNA